MSSVLLCGCRIRKTPPEGDGPVPVSETSGLSTGGHAGEETVLLGGSGTTSASDASVSDEGSLSDEQGTPNKQRTPNKQSLPAQGLLEEEETIDGSAGKPSLREGFRVYAFSGGAALSSRTKRALEKLIFDGTAVDVAVRIVGVLESLPATNAGLGAALRLDGTTVECAAVVLDEEGRGAEVSGLRRARQPSAVALALYKLGGGHVTGASGDELAERLGLSLSSLVTEEAQARYKQDLARLVQGNSSAQITSLTSLYVSQALITEALRTPVPTEEETRLPVFALVKSPDGKSGLALSTGGRPLSLPGEAFERQDTLRFASLPSGEDLIGLPFGAPCSFNAESALKTFAQTRTSSLVVSAWQRACPGGHYFLRAGDATWTDLNEESFYIFPPKPALVPPASAPASASALAPSAAPVPPRTAPAPTQPPTVPVPRVASGAAQEGSE